MNAHAVDISEVAVFRVWNAGPNFVKRNVCGAREPKDGQSYRRNHKQRDQNLQKLFHYSTDLRVLELKLIELISYHVRAGASPPSQPARFSCRLCLLYVENLSNQKEVLQLSEALGMEGGLAPLLVMARHSSRGPAVFPEQLIATLPAHEAPTLHRQPDRARRQSSRVHRRKEACKTSQDSPGPMPPGRRSPQVAARQCARRCDGCWNTLQTLSCGRRKLARRVKSFPPSQAVPCKFAARAQAVFRQYQSFSSSLRVSCRSFLWASLFCDRRPSPQYVLLNFAGRGLREFGKECYTLRSFEVGQIRAGKLQ